MHFYQCCLNIKRRYGRYYAYLEDTLDESWAIYWCNGSGKHGYTPLYQETVWVIPHMLSRN